MDQVQSYEGSYNQVGVMPTIPQLQFQRVTHMTAMSFGLPIGRFLSPLSSIMMKWWRDHQI